MGQVYLMISECEKVVCHCAYLLFNAEASK
ncbi:hypothetical protein BURKHO8Y_70096 [Burkholderia sp. 8Y]|nr:hypothetical protein BURKHO8Y_70096 [Burkholderia sp. 8Y]